MRVVRKWSLGRKPIAITDTIVWWAIRTRVIAMGLAEGLEAVTNLMT